MPGWDYSGNGFYFITMVVQNRKYILGKIENDEMIFSDFGKIAKNEWYESFEIRQELFLDEFQIMPNHLHAIVIIKKPNGFPIKTTELDEIHDTTHDTTHVETHGRASLQSNRSNQSNQSGQPEQQTKFFRKPKSLSSFIGGYKSIVTKIDNFIDLQNLPIEKYNRNNKFWQPGYHDHVIRNKNEYSRIKNYIKNNPKNWNDDEFYK